MNKNLILGLAVAGALYWQFGRKKDEPESTESYEGSPIISPAILNADLERKVVITETGRVFVVLQGMKFAVTSDKALDDYIARNPDISRGAVAVTEIQISSLPMGALYANLVFHMNDQPIKI